MDKLPRYNHITATWQGRYPHHFDLYPLLGFKHGQHLPPEGFAPRDVRGVSFKCEPANPPVDPKAPRRRAGQGHRVKYLCAPCGTWVPFGRCMQHKCQTKRPRAA